MLTESLSLSTHYAVVVAGLRQTCERLSVKVVETHVITFTAGVNVMYVSEDSVCYCEQFVSVV